ncbi:MAG: thiamine-phosphate kinase, partial [Candidatus Latescibacteria bacterium]|nr:thiamine-phosphate kinase [Candidatus Latescibacterota bacterium]
GDDCAAYRATAGRSELLTTDTLVQGVHFLIDQISPKQLGHKALAVALSDIAGMGGIADHAFVSLSIPPHITVEYLEDLMDGVKSLAGSYSVNLLGGDTTSSLYDLVISVAVVGHAPSDRFVTRSGALKRDLIAVTGNLGVAAAGRWAADNPKVEVDSDDLGAVSQGFLTPEPHLNAGLLLATSGFVNSMMDVSDGIASDLEHICHQSGVGAVVDVEKLPIPPCVSRVAELSGEDPISWALAHGEDYVLLLTLPSHRLGDISERLEKETGCELSVIGEVTAQEGLSFIQDGQTQSITGGWDHFDRLRRQVL